LAALPRYLRSGVRSTRETIEHLRRLGVPLPQASRAVADCQRRGLLDDRACAQLWAEHWARQGYAAAAICERLNAKGLSDETMRAAIQCIEREGGDPQRARTWLAAGRNRGWSRTRAARALAARGHDDGSIEQSLMGWSGAGSDAEP